MNFPSKAIVDALKAQYKPGCRVELVSMTDPYTDLKPGEQGTVKSVDDTGTVVAWDCGSGLGAVWGEDEIKLLPTMIPDEVVDEILKLRTLPGCPNMFDTLAVQRLAFDNELYALVDFLETDRKAYSQFILTGERSAPCDE